MKNKLVNPFLDVNNREQPEDAVEIFQIPAAAPYIVQLKKMPKYYGPLDINKIQIKNLADMSYTFQEIYSPQYQQVSPQVGQYVVDYKPNSTLPDRMGTGQVLFNATDSGKWGIAKFKSLGNLNLKENIIDDNIEDSVIDYRLGKIVYGYYVNYLDGFIYDNNYYGLTQIDASAGNGIRVSGLNNLSYVETIVPSNASVFGATYLSRAYRHITFLDSNLKFGVFGHSSANTTIGVKSSAGLNLSDFVGWGAIAAPSNFVQYTTSIQLGNQLFAFGANATLNTSDKIVWKYDTDSNTGTLLASTPNNWQYGTACYDENGNIWLLNNKDSGNIGQVLKYSIWDNSYTVKTTISGTYFLFNNGSIIDQNKKAILMPYSITNSYNISFDKMLYYNIETNQIGTIQTNNRIKGTGKTTSFSVGGEVIGSQTIAGGDNELSHVDYATFANYKNFVRLKDSLLVAINDSGAGTNSTNIYRFRNKISLTADSSQNYIK